MGLADSLAEKVLASTNDVPETAEPIQVGEKTALPAVANAAPASPAVLAPSQEEELSASEDEQPQQKAQQADEDNNTATEIGRGKVDSKDDEARDPTATSSTILPVLLDKSTYTSYPEYFTVVMANEMDEKTAALGAKLQKLKSSYRKGEFAVPVPSMWGKAAL